MFDCLIAGCYISITVFFIFLEKLRMKTNKWVVWPFLEGLCKVVNNVIAKTLGMSLTNPSGAVLVTMSIGFIQMITGVLGARLKKRSAIKASGRQILRCIVIGIIAAVMSLTWVVAFIYGGEVSTFTFITTLSVIPGSIFGWIFFKDHLSLRHFCAIAIFLFSGYIVLEFPNLTELFNLPPWILLSLLNAFLLSLNETLARFQVKRESRLESLDPIVNNFWVGATTFLVMLVTSVFVGSWALLPTIPSSFWLGSCVMGLVVSMMFYFRLESYMGGATIAIKKLIAFTTRLTFATLLGTLIYHEPFGAHKLFGLFGFICAFAIMNNRIWKILSLHSKTASAAKVS